MSLRRRSPRPLPLAGATAVLALFALAAHAAGPAAGTDEALAFVDTQIAAHPGESGACVLDTGEEALIARAWLADHATKSIDVQYFIWSTDNIGILAAEALLRAAERGVKVRVIVDDFLLDAGERSLAALAAHPSIEIRIYNPKTSVGVSALGRAWNALTDFRGLNQRMHDKTFVVDGRLAITGGRNMAAEYYDYHHDYNFRDRDVLLAGDVVASVRDSFDAFWNSDLCVPVEKLVTGRSGAPAELSGEEAAQVYRDLHAYAASADNFAPGVRAAIASAAASFPRLAKEASWGRIDFLSDVPGKNETGDWQGGGRSSAELGRLLASATDHVVIESPYLVLSDRAMQLFRAVRSRGVRVGIVTNSMASTDNLQAFAGYLNQKEALLAMGLEIFEYRPDAATQSEIRRRELVGDLPAAANPAPVFGLHAKSMVVDSKTAFIGTFNLDPRSENLNTEVGVVLHDEAAARALEATIEADMAPGNSRDARQDGGEAGVPLSKRARILMWRMLPIQPLL